MPSVAKLLRVMHIVGARPNFPKVAPLIAEMAKYSEFVHQRLVHTGQHYDEYLSTTFFRDLALPAPDSFLSVGSGTHAQQTAKIMLAFEEVVLHDRPDWIVVVGDVNSTLACALVGAKLGIPVAHVEAGLRSFDRTMPEEINRLLTDQIADLLFTPSPDADANLRREGIDPVRIQQVGNVMIDSLVTALPRAAQSPVLEQLRLRPHSYGVVTLHRPANVDQPAALANLLAALVTIGRHLPLVFPVHPRTKQQLAAFGLVPQMPYVRLIEPQSYLDFLQLSRNAHLVLTDSGGLQEETSFLGVPCLTLRASTERPITVQQGTNSIVGTDPATIVRTALAILDRPLPPPPVIEGWDGKAAQRIVRVLLQQNDLT